MLTILYLAVLAVGLAVGGYGLWGLRRSFVPGSQSQPDVSARVLRLVPISVGAGAAVFGLVGLLLLGLTALEEGATVIWALGAGLLVGFAAQAILYYRVLREESSAPPTPDPARGLLGEVVIAIPANGIGQVAYQSDGRTVQIGASSATFETIPKGTPVVIERIVRRIAQVRPV